jgi:hypothetical protein
MTLEPGTRVWIRCEVKLGLFPDERTIQLESPGGHWEGVVDVRQLRDEIAEGPTAVLATVVESSETGTAARLPGQARRGRYFTAPVTQFEPCASA